MAVVVATGACLDGTNAPPPIPSIPSLRASQFVPVAIQLHLHGLSNHNGNDLPGSMQWHTELLRMKGLDAIWWTDHEVIFNAGPIRLRLDQATVGPGNTVAIPGTGAPWARPGALEPVLAQGAASVSVQDSAVGMAVTPLSSGSSSQLRMRLVSADPLVPLIWSSAFARPSVSQPELSIDVSPTNPNPTASFVIAITTSFHDPRAAMSQHLYVRIGPGMTADTAVVSDSEVRLQMPLNVAVGAWGHVDLDLNALLSRLPDGDDNTTSVFEFGVMADTGPAGFRFRRVDLVSQQRSEALVQAALQVMADRYQARYGIVSLIGMEQGATQEVTESGEHLHLNMYLPTGANFAPLARLRGSATEFVDSVHRAGGLVSVNHPFGTAPQGADAAFDAGRITRIADQLSAVNAWGADLLEVGYRARGHASLEHHLALWDLLSARGIRLCGDGVSDSHGGYTSDRWQYGRMRSWLWVRAGANDGLLEALAQCRIFFGDPDYWGGTVDIIARGVYAGGRITQRPAPDTLHTFYTERPDSPHHAAELAIIEVLSDGSTRTVFARPGDPIRFRTSEIRAIRAEVWGFDGTRYAFTNPIWVTP